MIKKASVLFSLFSIFIAMIVSAFVLHGNGNGEEDIYSLVTISAILLLGYIIVSWLFLVNLNKVEKAAIASREKFHTTREMLARVQEYVQAGYFSLNAKTSQIEWSSELLDLLGFAGNSRYTLDDFMKRVSQHDRQNLAELFRNAVSDPKNFRSEVRFKGENGERVLSVNGEVINRTGDSWSLLVFIFDITERKWNEEELQNKNVAILNAFKKLEQSQSQLKSLNTKLEHRVEERTRELGRSEEKFRILGESIPQMVWSAEPDGSMDFFNARWTEFTGMSAEDSIGWGWKKAIHNEDLIKSMVKWETSLATGDVFESEMRLRSKDGNFRWFIARAFPIRDEQNQIIKWFGSSTDIHEHKLLEEKKDEFIGIASHELKTPLTSLKAYIQLIRRSMNGRINGSSHVYMNKTNNYIKKLTGLIDDLLDVSRIQAGKMRFDMVTVNFDDFVRECVENFSNTVSTHQFKISGSTKARITGDKQRLEQVFINFLSNAVKYSPGKDRVDIILSNKDGQAVVCVKDDGIGIPKEKISKIFHRFYRVENLSPHFSGLGIGLYIASEIVRRHNGECWVESDEGRGARFYFSLPVQTQDQPAGEKVSVQMFGV